MQKKKRQKTDHIEMMTGIQEERKQRKERVLFFLPPAQCVLCESHADSGDLFWAPGFRAKRGKCFFGGGQPQQPKPWEHLRPTHSSQQCQILNPASKARDGTHVLMDTRKVPGVPSHNGSSSYSFICFLKGPHLWHMEFSRLGIESELLAYATAPPELSHIHSLCRSLQPHRILNPLSEPTSSRILCRVLNLLSLTQTLQRLTYKHIN